MWIHTPQAMAHIYSAYSVQIIISLENIKEPLIFSFLTMLAFIFRFLVIIQSVV
jgi:hypothetical protein